jgi:class 3 adenylate cyclase
VIAEETNPASAGESGGRLSEALDEAFARETRRGVLLIAVYSFLVSGFNAALRIADLVGHYSPPWEWTRDMTLGTSLLMVVVAAAAYVLTLRTRKPLVYAYLLVVFNGVLQAQTTFFFLWRSASIAFWPTIMAVRFQDVLGVALLLSVSALPLSRALTARIGLAACLIWPATIAVSFLTFVGSPLSLYLGPLGPGLGETGLAHISSPFVLIPDYLAIQVLLLAALSVLLIATVDQSRRHVVARVGTEVDLAFLRRLLPPDVAERVARTGDGRLRPVRRTVAVLFVGREGPEPSAADLAAAQAYYAEVERTAFANGGMVDRFTGGPIMVTFGALDPTPDAARRAVDCCRALVAGPPPGGQNLCMAAHLGEAVCGEAGGERSRVFSVIGDVVNTARRILDQAAPGAVLATDEVIKALGGGSDAMGFSPLGEATVRGRGGGVMLWRLA